MDFEKPTDDGVPSAVQENPMVRAGAFFSALLMLSVPLSTAVSIVMTFLVFGCWILSSAYKDLPRVLRSNPVAGSALLMYGLLLIGMLYGDAGGEAAFGMIRKYREFLLLIILLPFMQHEKYRRWVILAFIAGSVVTLFGSYLKELGVLPLSRQDTATFKSRITHNIFMAFFAYFCAYQATLRAERRWLWLGLWALAGFNLFAIVQGRTGQVIFVLLMLLLLFQRVKPGRALILAPLLVGIFIAALSHSGSTLRFQEGIENSRDYLEGRQDLGTSMGQRLYFWENSLRLIRESPLIGYGTGSFAREFARVTGGTEILTRNPHNEFLMITVQLGAIGFFGYLFFLGCQAWCLSCIPEQRRWFAQAMLLSLTVNSLLNTTFMDHTEGHWYASLIALSFAVLNRDRARTGPDSG